MRKINNWEIFVKYSESIKKDILCVRGDVNDSSRFTNSEYIDGLPLISLNTGEVTTSLGTKYDLDDAKVETLLACFENKHGYIETFCLTFEEFVKDIFIDEAEEMIKFLKSIDGKEWTDYAYRGDWTFGFKKIESLQKLVDVLSDYEENPAEAYNRPDKFTERALLIISKKCINENKKIIIKSQDAEIKDFSQEDKKRVIFENYSE